jgi:hypothetical protein
VRLLGGKLELCDWQKPLTNDYVTKICVRRLNQNSIDFPPRGSNHLVCTHTWTQYRYNTIVLMKFNVYLIYDHSWMVDWCHIITMKLYFSLQYMLSLTIIFKVRNLRSHTFMKCRYHNHSIQFIQVLHTKHINIHSYMQCYKQYVYILVSSQARFFKYYINCVVQQTITDLQLNNQLRLQTCIKQIEALIFRFKINYITD